MYQPEQQTTSQDIAALGMPAGMLDCVSVEPDVVHVWPEHWQALGLFDALSTQWRIGYSGATGLDYGAICAVFDLVGVPDTDRAERFEELRIMEGEALKVMREARQ